MRFQFALRLAAATTFFTNSVFAHPFAGQEHAHEARDAGFTVAHGATTGGIQPRYEVRQLMTEQPEQWSLFILALQRWMAQDKNVATGDGYYAIAGIHGVPEQSWGGVDRCANCNTAYGYCNHFSVVFPGWHRAYLTLVEQLLVENAIAVAQEYPSDRQAVMIDAAEKLRLPFWDWAAKPNTVDGQDFPVAFTQPMISVDGPNGPQTISNPLFQYDFEQPNNGDPFEMFDAWKQTLRYPDSQTDSASSSESSVASALNSAQPSLQEQVYNLLSNCPDWRPFSNVNGGTAQCAMSIEGIHNRIHQLTGGYYTNGKVGGHMAYLPVAAFDVAFWVHHANVDRIFALWQTVNPNSYGASQPIGYPTWTYADNEVQDANSDLTPFYSSASGEFHNLNSVRDWTQFNYNYPEFLSSDGSRQSIETIISAYYGPDATLTAGSIPVSKNVSSSSNESSSSSAAASSSTSSVASSVTSSPAFSTGVEHVVASTSSASSVSLGSSRSVPSPTPAPEPSSSSVVPSTLPNIPGLSSFLNSSGAAADQAQEQYVANIVANAHVLGMSYLVYVFDGAPQGNPDSYGLASNLIGSVVMMSHGGFSSNSSSFGAVPLTFFLQNMVNKGELSSMSPQVVLPWLQKNLEWRIVGMQGVVPADSVRGFSLSIYSSSAQISQQGSLPQWEPVTPQIGTTKGKAGGANSVPNFFPAGKVKACGH